MAPISQACHLKSTHEIYCPVALHDLDALPFRAAAAQEEDYLEEESHTLSGYGVLHHDVLYPRGELRFVISKPRRVKRRGITRVWVDFSNSQTPGTVGANACRRFINIQRTWAPLSVLTSLPTRTTCAATKPFGTQNALSCTPNRASMRVPRNINII